MLSLFRKPIFSFSLFPRVIDGCLPFILYIYYIQDYFLYYILVCLSKVFQRTIFLSGSRFSGKAFAKVRRFFCNLQIFFESFFEKIFGRSSEGVRLILSRSLAILQGKILGAAVSTIFRSLKLHSVCHLQRLSLSKAVAKVQTFSVSATFTPYFFAEIFQVFS